MGGGNLEVAKQNLEKVEERISAEIAERNAKLVEEQINVLDTTDGKFSQLGLWKVKNRICPRAKDPPMAKRDEHGNLITAPNALKDLYIRTYKERLRHREIGADYKELQVLKSELWDLRFKSIRLKVTAPWTLSELNKVTKSLKKQPIKGPKWYGK